MHACIFENGKFKINKGFGGDGKGLEKIGGIGKDRSNRKG